MQQLTVVSSVLIPQGSHYIFILFIKNIFTEIQNLLPTFTENLKCLFEYVK